MAYHWKVFWVGSELFKTGFPNRENFSCFLSDTGREAASTQFDPKNDLPGGINIAFADNHVELVRLERMEFDLASAHGKGSILSSAHAVILLIFVGGHDYLPPR